MRYCFLLVVLASLALALVGCSRSSSTAVLPQINDFGIIEVSGGMPSNHTLADGRVCTVTPAILVGGNVRLTTLVVETNASGIKRTTHVFDCPVGQTVTFAHDKDTVITVTLRNSK
jgi:hypothetical protein